MSALHSSSVNVARFCALWILRTRSTSARVWLAPPNGSWQAPHLAWFSAAASTVVACGTVAPFVGPAPFPLPHATRRRGRRRRGDVTGTDGDQGVFTEPSSHGSTVT